MNDRDIEKFREYYHGIVEELSKIDMRIARLEGEMLIEEAIASKIEDEVERAKKIADIREYKAGKLSEIMHHKVDVVANVLKKCNADPDIDNELCRILARVALK